MKEYFTKKIQISIDRKRSKNTKNGVYGGFMPAAGEKNEGTFSKEQCLPDFLKFSEILASQAIDAISARLKFTRRGLGQEKSWDLNL